MTNEEILDSISTKDTTWIVKAQWRRDNEFWLKKIAPIIIKVLRKKREEDISIEDMAGILEMSFQEYKNMVTGVDVNISFKTLCLIEKFLEIQIFIV